MSIDLTRIEEWLVRKALPLWSEAGWDSVHGGFFEGLEFSEIRPTVDQRGQVPDKRLRTQARQLYVFSHAAQSNLFAGAADVAANGYAFLTEKYWRDDGGWMFSVAADGAPRNTDLRVYEQAFALLALAWFLRIDGGGRVARQDIATLIDQTISVLDRDLRDPTHGGYWDPSPARLPRAQNPHMHLLEAWLALYEATKNREFLDRAAEIITLFDAHFFDPDANTLGEFYTENWLPAPGREGQLIEPGHHFEWVWLLSRYAALAGRDMSDRIAGLFDFAARHGVDSDGLAFNGITKSRDVADDGKRLWVQTEQLKAYTSLFEATRDGDYAVRADQLLESLFGCYLDGRVGHWREQLERDGNPNRTDAPATSFYHVFVALTEVMRVFGDDVQ